MINQIEQKKAFWETTVFQYAVIILLAGVVALNYKLFIVPNKFAPAGFNGLATMIQYKLNFSIGYMTMLINVPLCIFAFFTTNRRFAIRTFVYVSSYSVIYLILQQIDMRGFIYDAKGTDTIFPCAIAGIISGTVYGIIFQMNASSGGTDIIAKFSTVKNPRLNFFWVTFALNAVVAGISYFIYADEIDGVVYYDLKPVCLCLVYCFVSSFVGNRIMSGTKTAYNVVIVTTHMEEIEREIMSFIHHGATHYSAVGSYSHLEKSVIFCVINRSQLVDLKNILKKYEDTFAYVEPVSETVGKFAHVKPSKADSQGAARPIEMNDHPDNKE
ncbi:MAG: YitT family protein [Clostridia bacterium]|nr:YitT family protein [Clostridia bacterium]